MVKYVDFMCDIISKYNIKTNLDQGIHNYMLYLNKLKTCLFWQINFLVIINFHLIIIYALLFSY